MKNNDLLLVIDMQNVYLPGEEWACPSMPDAIQNIQDLLNADVVGQVVFTRFTAPENPVGTWKTYNLENEKINKNEDLNEIVKELQPYTEKHRIYDKSTYSSLRVKEIAETAAKADHILLAGVVAECCVLATLMEAIDNGCPVVYLTDCISGQSDKNEHCIKKIAESFSPVHTAVTDSKAYLQSIQP